MSIKTVDVGGLNILNVYFKGSTAPTSFALKLFTDTSALSDADTNATHTTAAGGGYADKTLSLAGATVAANGSGIPAVSWANQAFVFTGPLTGNPTVYGYAVLSGTTLVFEELLGTPFTPSSNGDTLNIAPTFLLGNGTPA